MQAWSFRERGRRASLGVILALGLLLWNCASGAGSRPALNLSPEEWARAIEERGLSPSAVPSPVEATPEIRRAAFSLAGAGTPSEKLVRLHAALLDRREYAFEYEEVGTFTAKEAFEARKGNCVSFTNLLVAMGRSVGIPLQAGLVLPRGASDREKDLIVVYAHMVAVHQRGPERDVYDFYREKMSAGELRLLDDLEVAAIALSNRGVAALRETDLAGARTLLAAAVRLGPRLPDIHSNLGIALWRQGDIDGALATFRRGLALDPHRAALLHNLAGLYLQLGSTSEARVALAAANMGQASPFLLVVKGDLEYAAGELAAALKSYKKAHARDRRLVEPLLAIARTEQALGNPRAARKALEKARLAARQ